MRLVSNALKEAIITKLVRKENGMLHGHCMAVDVLAACSHCLNVQVVTANGKIGTIEGSFGKSGKFKVQFPGSVSLSGSGSNAIRLTFKKFIFDKDKRHMAQ